MSKSLQERSRWLVGCVVGVSLLGACAAQEEGGAALAGGETQHDTTAALRGAGVQDVEGVTARLSVDRGSFGAQEDVRVTVTLTNRGLQPVSLLKWYTPAEGVEEELFEVTREGEPVPFIGPHYKRPAPTAGDFLGLAPGESLTRTVSLSGLYDFSRTGRYELHLAVESLSLLGLGAGPSRVLESNAVSVWVEGRDVEVAKAPVGPTAGSITYTGDCTLTQQATLVEAVNAARVMSDDSVAYLSNTTPSGTPRYTTWFGAFSATGWSTARTHFLSIQDGFYNKPLTLDCKCKKSYYAYVYPNDPYKIYLCNAFWAAPMTGTDSKGGTLIHEMSHFDVVAGTNDWAYGQSACKSLALSDPNKALNNADSHEYFAENTPYLQ